MPKDPRTPDQAAEALMASYRTGAAAAPSPTKAEGEFPVDAGTINFAVHRNPNNPEFIKCRPWADKELIVEHSWKQWGLDPTPGVLTRVTGSVAGLNGEEAERVEGIVEGLIKASHTASGWLFSTGLDFGVSNLVGGIVARNRHVCSSPLIGVAAWRTVQNREQLEVDTKGKPAAKGAKRNCKQAKRVKAYTSRCC